MLGHISGLCRRGADALFGPQLPGKFDFTLFFEHTILDILPSFVFLVVFSICFVHLVRQPRLVGHGALWWLKMVTSACLLATDVCALAIWCSHAAQTQAAVAAASMSCLATICVMVLANTEHRRSLHSSGWLSLYLGVYTVLCAVKARSLFLRPELHSLAVLKSLSISFMVVMLILGELPKTSEIIDPQQRDTASSESLAGFWSRSCFVWLLPILSAGSSRLLSIDDLHTLQTGLQGEMLFTKFAPIWSRRNKRSSKMLFMVLARTLIRSIFLAMLPRLALTGFSFSQPYLLERVVSLLESDHPRHDFESGLVGAASLIYVGITMSRAWYNYLIVRMATKTRGILISAIFDKTLKLEHRQAKKLAAVTLMSTDADGVAGSVRTIYELLANLLEVGVGMGLLATRVGPACILLLVPTTLLSVISTKLGKDVGPSQIKWNKSTEDRVSKTSALLRQMRAIKMSGQGPAAIHYIQELRKTEIEESRQYRLLQAIIFANAMLIYCLTPITVMAGSIFWTRAGHELKPSEVFTVLSIVAIVSTPLSKVMASYPRMQATFGRLKRIEAFLQLEERAEHRQFEEPSFHGLNENSEKNAETAEAGIPDQNAWDTQPVYVRDASISASRTSDPLIRGASFWIPRRKFTMLAGKTGSGKSTLLRALLGEAPITKGTISLRSQILAYCNREVWIQNLSIRQNVVGACEYDAGWYCSVLRICQLVDEVQALPCGDETIVGSDGLRLSGGQKARLELARGVYSLAPLIILDDILSALDAKTADAIVNALVGPRGVLRGTACSVVLATSSGKFLPMADHLIYLDENRQTIVVPNRAHIPGYAKYLEIDPTSGRVQTGPPQAARSETLSGPKLPPAGRDQPDPFRQKGDMKLYLIYFKSVPKNLLMFWIALLALFALSERSPEIYMRIWLATFPTNKLFFIGYGLLGISCGILGLSHIYTFWLRVTPRASENLHKQFLEVVMSATYQFITSTDAGFLLNRFSGDMSVIGQELPNSMYLVVYDVYLVCIDIGILLSASKYMAFTVLFLFSAFYILQKFYLRTSRQMRFLDLEANSPLYTHFIETARGLAHIRGFQWEAKFVSKFYKLLSNCQKPNYHLAMIQQWLTASMDCLGMALGITLVALASKLSDSSPSGTGLALLNLITFSEQLMFAMNNWTGLETSLGAIARLDTFVKSTPVEKDAADATPVSPTWPENGTIEFRGVNASYSARDSTDNLVLNQLSLRIPGGSKLGVVGRTGCGKTTIFLTLLHMLEHSGPVLIDGINISEVPRQLLRTRITTISQDFFELPGTLRDNLLPPRSMRPKDLKKRLDDEAILNILFVTGLRDIVSQRGGLNAPFDELGFSHGEMQLVALTRGAIHTLEFETKIVLLDEVTGALDGETQTKIWTAMDQFFANHTVITITHRAEGLSHVNKIYDMNTNQIYRQGSL